MSATNQRRGKIRVSFWAIALLILIAVVYAMAPSEVERRAAKIEECARKVRNAAVLSGTDIDATSVCERTMKATGELR